MLARHRRRSTAWPADALIRRQPQRFLIADMAAAGRVDLR